MLLGQSGADENSDNEVTLVRHYVDTSPGHDEDPKFHGVSGRTVKVIFQDDD